MAKDQAACISNLVIKELAEVFLIHLALLGINNSCEAVKLYALSLDILNCSYNIGKLADARGLDKYPVGVVLSEHLL